jgi:hypothetical protein
MSTTSTEWIRAFAEQLGVEPPDGATVETLLSLAGTAAHASERVAAPIACYLVGLAGADPAAARTLAEGLSDVPPDREG